MVNFRRMNTSASIDLAMVRDAFPAFQEPALADQVFLENAGGSYACAPVIERLEQYYRKTKVQPYYPSAPSRDAGDAMDASYTRLAPWLGVTPDWLHFGPSTTQNAYVLAQAAHGFLTSGDNIVVTEQEHEANSGAWRRLAQTGIDVREWRVLPDSGRLDPDDLDQLLDDRTRIVAFTHCSNIVGHINPVAVIAKKVRDAGAISIVDGVSSAAHGFPDVAALGADVYLFSLYKTYGPHQGLMVIRPDVAQTFVNQSHFFNADQPRKRLVPAGPDHAQVAAAQGIADYFEAVVAHHDPTDSTPARARLARCFGAAEDALLKRLLDGLAELKGVRVIGPTSESDRAPTVSLLADAIPSDELCRALAEHGVMAGSGHFYAKRLLQAMGIDDTPGVLRLSFVHYTSGDDIDAALDALDRCLAARRH
ncbi:MAG: aminotransferase class V-fold PLP-dependent enzyme [Pseudomonadota bacterium]